MLTKTKDLTPFVNNNQVPVGNVRIHVAYANPTGNGGLGVFLTQGVLNTSTNFPVGRTLFTNQDAFGPWVDIPIDTLQSRLYFELADANGLAFIASCPSGDTMLSSSLLTQGKEIWMWTDGGNSCSIGESFPFTQPLL